MRKIKNIQKEILENLSLFKEVAEKATGLKYLAGHYGMPQNGKYANWFRDVLNKVGLDESHLRQNHIENITLRPIINKECPICNKNFQTKQGASREGRFCSKSCSNRQRKHSKETIEKIRATFTKNGKVNKPKKHTCKFCKRDFYDKNIRLYCSHSCRGKDVAQRPGFREKLSLIQKKCILNGKHKGWISREKVNISYPERFFIKVLNNNKINFNREVSLKGYFIDFAIILSNGFQIALEIDGKQHQEPNRQYSDRCKNIVLEKYGWNVYRIAWKSINSKPGKEYIKLEIDKFLKYYKEMSK